MADEIVVVSDGSKVNITDCFNAVQDIAKKAGEVAMILFIFNMEKVSLLRCRCYMKCYTMMLLYYMGVVTPVSPFRLMHLFIILFYLLF